MVNNKKLLFFCLALIVIAALLLGVYFLTRDTPAQGEKTISITVVHGDESEKTYTYHTDAEYLGETLLKEGLIAGDEGEFGLYVNTVDGETADASKQEWWCLTKESGMVNTGVDMTVIADGDAFELTLTTGW
ncbi:DUF4430 domain-containing protein [Christensenellaceae bacterium OttesenSCG-928-M15]|nr:DUF4430 domain-containing protein [Christensenellaceae bacterium OttesenSCG-928-M15]